MENQVLTIEDRPRLTVIFCSVMTREVCYCAARSRAIVTPVCLPSGLHGKGAEVMSAKIQEAVDLRDDGSADAIVLGFGLCNNGVVGLRARKSPLVVARAHDCITYLLGSKERYREVFDAEPGTYYFTPGWLESPPEVNPLEGQGDMAQEGFRNLQREQLIEKYGAENAEFILATLKPGTTAYARYLWVGSEVGEFPEYEDRVREKAERDGKRFETTRGSLALIQHALDGEWDEDDFVICRPGQRIVAKVSGGILDVESVED